MTDSAPPLSDALPGTWELLSRIDVTAKGEEREEASLGSDPLALLFYDRAGHFAAQFMKRDRSGSTASELGPAGSNNSRAIGGYDAYFGTYSVDDGANRVAQRLIGSLAVETVGLEIARQMTVSGDRLVIELDTTVNGEPVTRTLTWRRVG